MFIARTFTAILVAAAALSSGGCVATYVEGKAVGAAVDVTTTAVSVTAHGAAAAVGVVTGGDDCESDDRDEDCE